MPSDVADCSAMLTSRRANDEPDVHAPYAAAVLRLLLRVLNYYSALAEHGGTDLKRHTHSSAREGVRNPQSRFRYYVWTCCSEILDQSPRRNAFV